MLVNRRVAGERVLIICIILAISLSSCGGARDALDRVLETRILRVGMDASFPPFEYVDGDGNLVGFDVDLARELARWIADDVADFEEAGAIEVQFVANLPYDGLYDALTADRVDIVISALYVDPTRTANFVYSEPYFNAGQVLVVGEGSSLEEMADLGGLRLAVEFGSEGDVVAREWSRRLEGLEIVTCQSAAEAIASLQEGSADAALVDHVSALAGIGEAGQLRVVKDTVTDEPYAVALRAESRGLLRVVDRALEQLETDGTLGILRQRWFRTGP